MNALTCIVLLFPVAGGEQEAHMPEGEGDNMAEMHDESEDGVLEEFRVQGPELEEASPLAGQMILMYPWHERCCRKSVLHCGEHCVGTTEYAHSITYGPAGLPP